MNQHLRVNKTSFHMKGFALGLALKQRRKATRKPPIDSLEEAATKTSQFFLQFSVHGGYNDWSSWSNCSEDCNGGTQTRDRFCTRPRPASGGFNCTRLGPSRDARACNTFACGRCTLANLLPSETTIFLSFTSRSNFACHSVVFSAYVSLFVLSF